MNVIKMVNSVRSSGSSSDKITPDPRYHNSGPSRSAQANQTGGNASAVPLSARRLEAAHTHQPPRDTERRGTVRTHEQMSASSGAAEVSGSGLQPGRILPCTRKNIENAGPELIKHFITDAGKPPGFDLKSRQAMWKLKKPLQEKAKSLDILVPEDSWTVIKEISRTNKLSPANIRDAKKEDIIELLNNEPEGFDSRPGGTRSREISQLVRKAEDLNIPIPQNGWFIKYKSKNRPSLAESPSEPRPCTRKNIENAGAELIKHYLTDAGKPPGYDLKGDTSQRDYRRLIRTRADFHKIRVPANSWVVDRSTRFKVSRTNKLSEGSIKYAKKEDIIELLNNKPEGFDGRPDGTMSREISQLLRKAKYSGIPIPQNSWAKGDPTVSKVSRTNKLSRANIRDTKKGGIIELLNNKPEGFDGRPGGTKSREIFQLVRKAKGLNILIPQNSWLREESPSVAESPSVPISVGASVGQNVAHGSVQGGAGGSGAQQDGDAADELLEGIGTQSHVDMGAPEASGISDEFDDVDEFGDAADELLEGIGTQGHVDMGAPEASGTSDEFEDVDDFIDQILNHADESDPASPSQR